LRLNRELDRRKSINRIRSRPVLYGWTGKLKDGKRLFPGPAASDKARLAACFRLFGSLKIRNRRPRREPAAIGDSRKSQCLSPHVDK